MRGREKGKCGNEDVVWVEVNLKSAIYHQKNSCACPLEEPRKEGGGWAGMVGAGGGCFQLAVGFPPGAAGNERN